MKDPKVGDVVRLRSGGPKITVVNTELPSNVYCAWITGDGKPQVAPYPASALEMVDAAEQRQADDESRLKAYWLLHMIVKCGLDFVNNGDTLRIQAKRFLRDKDIGE